MLLPQAETNFFPGEHRPALPKAMRLVAGPVSVVTAGVGTERTGATVTTAHSLSVEPEVMVVSINRSSSTFTAIAEHRHFCINVLAVDQSATADRFAGRGGIKGPARYDGARWRKLETGALALEDALTSIDCIVEDIILRHSHALILGRVQAIVIGEAGRPPLLYRDGRYGSYSDTVRS